MLNQSSKPCLYTSMMFIILILNLMTIGVQSETTQNGLYQNKSVKEIRNDQNINDQQNQTYYLSEQEYKLIDLDDIFLDYQYQDFTTDCDPKNVQIIKKSDKKFIKYSEQGISTSIRSIITFANQNTLKVNGIGLLSNSTLMTYVDDASSINSKNNQTATHLRQIRLIPIQNQDSCSNLKKSSSDSFLFECVKVDPSTQQHIITLFQFQGDNFSNADGIDLTSIQPKTTILDFDVQFAFNSTTNLKVSDDPSYQTFLKEYYSCIRDTGFYFNKDKNILNYFRICKYHETSMQGDIERKYTNQISSFFELYNLAESKDGRITGISPEVSFPSDQNQIKIKTQGVEQVIDDTIIVLDFDEGLLFFKRDQNGKYKNQDYFIKYFYDQKYLNLFTQTNQDIEFSIQDSTPNYVVVNTQMYLIMYEMDPKIENGLNTFPQTVSISHFIQSVQEIHKKNKQFDKEGSNYTNNISSMTTNIRDVQSFKSIRYNFDQYLYYIEIKFVNNDNSYFLLINRGLTDHSENMAMNAAAIELDYLTNSTYSKIFHYPIPGLFYSNIRTRVRLLELGSDDLDNIDLNLFKEDPSKNTLKSGSIHLSISTYSWKSSQVLKLFTNQFDQISKCQIKMIFEAKKTSVATGNKEIIADINLIPRNFNGVISKQGDSISKKFFNPQPKFQIKDWFFGPGINYNYTSSGPNNVSMMIYYNSTSMITDTPDVNVTRYSSNFGTCDKVQLCEEKLLAAIQVGTDYYIFFQNCYCLFWFEKCTITPKNMFSIQKDYCKKSSDVTLTQNADKVLFDGANILVVQNSQKPQNLKDGNSTQISPNLIYMKVQEQDQIIENERNDQNQKSSNSSKYQDEESQCKDPSSQTLKNHNSTKQNYKRNKHTKKNQDQISNFKLQKLDKLVVSQPQNLNLQMSLDKILSLSIFCIPNTVKYGVIVQFLSFKKMAIFSLSKDVQDLTIYDFQDQDQAQDSYDASLLDLGIIVASRNTVSAANPGQITIYKVNFISKKINVDRIFTQKDMISQIQNMQNSVIQNDGSVNSGEAQPISSDKQAYYDKKIQQMKSKNIVYVDDISRFMNNFSVKIWRNDDSQTYRFLLIDYENNCLLDYYFYDLIKPIFIRQVNLYDFQITQNQRFQITNNMICLHVTKNNQNYLISLQINGESIDQLRQIELQQDKQIINYSQVQQSLGTPYIEGTICGVFSFPLPQIKCIFNPEIQLDFDFSQQQSQKSNTTQQESQLKSLSSDKQVDFKLFISTDINLTEMPINLHTDFSNFDTNLVSNSDDPITYDAKAGNFTNDNKMRIALNTSFVNGSIEDYYIVPSDKGVHIQGYIDTQEVQNNSTILKIDDPLETDRNPFQLVSLLDKQLVVVNQNMKFDFSEIYRIDYSNIKVRKRALTDQKEQGSDSKIEEEEDLQLCSCGSIYSNEIQKSQTTSTFQYILRCQKDKKNQVYITFNVDVNHYSPLEDQALDWQKAMSNNVRRVDIKFAEEDLESMFNQIKAISILSLTDYYNNIAGYIFMIVRELNDPNRTNTQQDYTIYVLWAEQDEKSVTFKMQEIEQINCADFNLNTISVHNFIASFPSEYHNQTRLNSKKKQDFVFNIGWDDGKRYVTLSLLKLSLPPQTESDDVQSENKKLIFNTQFYDINSDTFSSFIKQDQTYKVPFTSLKSTITFVDNSYDASVIITNEFSIIEFTTDQSPAPYITTKSNKPQKVEQDKFKEVILDHTISKISTNQVKQVVTYTQYAWCNNAFNINSIQQQILKYNKYLIIMCIQPTKENSLTLKFQSILKVYKVETDNDNTDDSDNTESSDDKNSIQDSNSKPNPQPKINSQKFSMVQSIEYAKDADLATTSVLSMSFRQDNQVLYLNLIISNQKTYQLLQFPINQNPILIYDSNIEDNQEFQICTKNKYPQEVCSTAIFSNPFIDINDQSKKQWIKFSGLVALPLFLTLSVIFVSFVFMKKLRKKRQDEFVVLLNNQSMAQYKSKSEISFVEPSVSEQKTEKKVVAQRQKDTNPELSISDNNIFTFNDNNLNVSTENY